MEKTNAKKRKKKEEKFGDYWETDESSEYPVHERYVKEENIKRA